MPHQELNLAHQMDAEPQAPLPSEPAANQEPMAAPGMGDPFERFKNRRKI